MGMTRRITGRWRVAAKLAVLIGAIVIASSQFIGAPRAADPIKIGWVGPLSPPGGYAEGTLMKQAAQLAADEINAKGGVLGRQIQVVFADTRGKPEEGTAAAERLISQEKVVAITGEFHSSVFLAEMRLPTRRASRSSRWTCGRSASPPRGTRRCSGSRPTRP